MLWDAPHLLVLSLSLRIIICSSWHHYHSDIASHLLPSWKLLPPSLPNLVWYNICTGWQWQTNKHTTLQGCCTSFILLSPACVVTVVSPLSASSENNNIIFFFFCHHYHHRYRSLHRSDIVPIIMFECLSIISRSFYFSVHRCQCCATMPRVTSMGSLLTHLVYIILICLVRQRTSMLCVRRGDVWWNILEKRNGQGENRDRQIFESRPWLSHGETK